MSLQDDFLLKEHELLKTEILNKSLTARRKTVTSVQLIINKEETNQWQLLIGKKITVTITLERATTMHHHAQVIGDHVKIN